MSTRAENSHSPGVPYLDRLIHAWIGRFTLGVSPVSLMLTYYDWMAHLVSYPGKIAELFEGAFQNAMRFSVYAARSLFDPTTASCPCIEPLPQDHRFSSPDWSIWPFNLFCQSFLLAEQWWQNAVTGIQGVSRHHEEVASFVARQILDIFSPSNFIFSNPVVLKATIEEGGMNLVSGLQNLIKDWEQGISGKGPAGTEEFVVGKNLAVTPGKVVFRNRLIELLQYSPSTEKVYAEPVLMVPAWIMKYYILDLSPDNSLARYLVDHGYTVFMISWKNPGPEDRDLGMEDYINLGIMDALEAISSILPDCRVHALGYCLGGTLLSIAAAAMGRDGDDRLKSVTLLTAQTDFTEAGELMIFIDESEVSFIENIMWEQGYLDTKQMAGVFQLLRSNDLIWSRMVRDYLLGERQPMTDLMAWNADATRMPQRMHSEYLRSLFLNNDLAEGLYKVKGKPIAITDIHIPIFVVSTVHDHVAPWRSVYKIHLFADTEVTFILTSGGHNAGIVSEPGHHGRSYQMATQREGNIYVDPDRWKAITPVREGSWWPAWEAWLGRNSSNQIPPPTMGSPERGYPPLGDAPGTYVLQP
jgi:polyhydroxyalkanoate synthase